jgi:hypothetical protein
MPCLFSELLINSLIVFCLLTSQILPLFFFLLLYHLYISASARKVACKVIVRNKYSFLAFSGFIVKNL